jgi:hypothetical protein
MAAGQVAMTGASGPASPPELLLAIISAAELPPVLVAPVDAVLLWPPLPVLNIDELFPLCPHEATATATAAAPAIQAPAYRMARSYEMRTLHHKWSFV